jgi:CRISPR-associated protein Cas2
MKFFLVAYDIADDNRRTKVAKRLEQTGQRVQESVFEVPIAREADLARLQRDLGILAQPGDSIRFYRLCASCREASTTLAGEPVALVPAFVLL